MDSLPEDEIEAIWSRVKHYIDTKNIKSISRQSIADELEREMLSDTTSANEQANSKFLIKRGFVDVALGIKPAKDGYVENIREELLEDNIRAIRVKEGTRFQVAKGTPTFITLEGKTIRAGQFLSGKSQADAIKQLEKRAN